MSKLTTIELKRYHRHLILKGFGAEGQARLKDAKVLVVGAGGLGCPALLYLAAAGVGKIGIVDSDVVEVTNLQRQVLYTEADIGKSKAQAAENRLRQLNPFPEYRVYHTRLHKDNAEHIVSDYDVVIDGTDNFPTRYLINDCCVLLGKAMVYGSVLQFEGHVAVFNFRYATGQMSNNYRDLFPEPPAPDSVPSCETAGVLGVVPGIIGSIQAAEAMKIITGSGEPLADRLLVIDTLDMSQSIVRMPDRNSRDSIRHLIDYEDFCGISRDKNKSLEPNQQDMKEVTVQELQKLKDSGADFQLIDVREPYEYDICNLEGELIPMSEIPNSVEKISRDKKVVLHCRSGKRSGDMLLWLEKNHGFNNLYNLKGGILAWAKDIDPEMPTY
ncbi:MAG TPA: molybdopterin-synthase adenylyltransferase MoeB [Chryseosolibacter sp.]|nr:molybdopterin-synthase adenylyltransferase MoeB [Chryseosolibacter sp.]